MNDLQNVFKVVGGVVIILASIALGIWLSLFVMLYGGIMSAIENWGIDNSAVVWGIIRAVFCEVGIIPAYIFAAIGVGIIQS